MQTISYNACLFLRTINGSMPNAEVTRRTKITVWSGMPERPEKYHDKRASRRDSNQEHPEYEVEVRTTYFTATFCAAILTSQRGKTREGTGRLKFCSWF
jgi:hypothetical protein